MKILILKLGILAFTFTFLVGAFREMPLFTMGFNNLIFRSFTAFLGVEAVLVMMAVIIIKTTEQLRVETEEAGENEEDFE